MILAQRRAAASNRGALTSTPLRLGSSASPDPRPTGITIPRLRKHATYSASRTRSTALPNDGRPLLGRARFPILIAHRARFSLTPLHDAGIGAAAAVFPRCGAPPHATTRHTRAAVKPTVHSARRVGEQHRAVTARLLSANQREGPTTRSTLSLFSESPRKPEREHVGWPRVKRTRRIADDIDRSSPGHRLVYHRTKARRGVGIQPAHKP